MNARVAAVLAVLAMLAVAWRLGALEAAKDPAALAASLVAMGAWGYLAFVLAYTSLQPFGVPGTVFVFAAPLIWPWPIAFALSMTGTMAASVVGFSFARFVARDWVAKRLPARFARYERALEERGFATVAWLRFVFWMPQVLHAFLGVSRVGFWTHFWGSLVGYVVPLLLVSYFGQKIWDVLREAPPSTWASVAAVVLGAAATTWALGRRRRRSAERA